MYSYLLSKLLLPVGSYILGREYLSSLNLWNQYDSLTEEELVAIQNKRLIETLKDAIQNIPFYSKNSLNPELSALDNLRAFPVLTKEILKMEKKNLVSTNFDPTKLIKNYSSGSSGIQSFTYSEKKHSLYLQGLQSHWYMWSGYRLGDSILQFGISPERTFLKSIKDFFFQVTYINAFSLSEKDYLQIYQRLLKKKIKFIIGYPSSINEFAKFLIRENLTYPIQGIITLGDKLFLQFEKSFEQAFERPKIIDTYGCAEGCLMASRKDLPFYYIMTPHVVVEIVDDLDNPVEDGKLGHVLVTCLTNKAMPLIRYKLGDLAIKLPKAEYPLNRNFNYPLLQKIIGRETDIVKAPNGTTLVVHSFTGIFEFYPEIKQFQIKQSKIEWIEILYIIDSHFSFNESVLASIKEKIDCLTNGTLGIQFSNVKEIKATLSGKPQIIDSKLIGGNNF